MNEETQSTPSMPRAGWLLDPENPTMERWWDGTNWTDQRRIVNVANTRPDDTPRDPGKVLPAEIVATILIPLVGLILAIVSFVRGEFYRGGNLLLVTVVVAIAWAVLIAAASS